ncbi:PP2C family protein-serine/threonine phosphatase [Paenibacillus arenilitoris]|uniref:Serine/threonine-protein phosphatase n=1 Tax=Paenibacillus arenilitoris TaxID=2772299 RepID=A0A927CHL4_9BACL|nr:protein phosphatase 2C domain-containing protein [Paenibacillus arenilitoris]MBD2868243.1 serine/threonine-protein phosphatase [Paenibacillus arenilitoris]
MLNKGMSYGLWAVFLLLVAGFIATEAVPAEFWEGAWTKEQGEVIEQAVKWSTFGFSVLLAILLLATLLADRRQQKAREREKPSVPKKALAAAGSPRAARHEAIEVHADKAGAPAARRIVPAARPGMAVKQGASKAAISVMPGMTQHIGAREEQQDAYFVSAQDDPEILTRCGVLAVLADGMGGFEMGREAGQLAVKTMAREYMGKTAAESVPKALDRAMRQAGAAVYGLARRHGLEWSVGTTLIGAVVQAGRLYWCSVGDSRVYLYRRGELTQLTRDHVYANRLQARVERGEMTQAEAEWHPERHLLTSYLGIPELEEIDANDVPLSLEAGDWVLLCSDGLYDALSARLLEEASRLAPQQAAEWIVRHALSRRMPYQDNATIVILACT